MIENEKEFHCSLQHNLPILMVVCDTKLKRNQRLLCSKCLENFDQKAQLMSFNKVFQTIVENQKQKKESVENVIMFIINLIEELQKDLIILKSNVALQLDYIIRNVDEWIGHIKVVGQQQVTYSFYDQLDKLINQNILEEFNQKSLIDHLNQIQQSGYQKIERNLKLFKQFQQSQKCEEILKKLRNINETKENIKESKQSEKLEQTIQVDKEQKQFEQQFMNCKQVEFNLIDDSNKQSGWCFAIVFNQEGSIMVSTEMNKIKIWNFQQGRLKLTGSYNKHTAPINCMVFSKRTNNFISGGDKQEIICWQQINESKWNCSQPFKQHSSSVECLLLNKQEDQLISGGCDHKIIVWQVDFIKNDLIFLYLLNQHRNSIESLSFNQSETVFASCGYDEFIIWEKGLQEKWEFKYKQEVSKGRKIHFVNNHEFLWVTLKSKINDLLVFELQNGIFKQNKNKTITLIKNDECKDDVHFPIVHNKDRNVILVRHKHHIYFIRQLKNSTFNIITSLNCHTKESYGTMTNDGQFLVFWDNKQEKYSSYEIQYK